MDECSQGQFGKDWMNGRLKGEAGYEWKGRI
jgi:hypothetical protein